MTEGRMWDRSAVEDSQDCCPRRVRFDGGWFWTTAFCHGDEADELAFRQRPDGEGIDARCHAGEVLSPVGGGRVLGHRWGGPSRARMSRWPSR